MCTPYKERISCCASPEGDGIECFVDKINVINSCKGNQYVGEGGHVRIAKVQHTLTKAVHALGCLYLVIIMSNYSRFIMPVKKLQFPP